MATTFAFEQTIAVTAEPGDDSPGILETKISPNVHAISLLLRGQLNQPKGRRRFTFSARGTAVVVDVELGAIYRNKQPTQVRAVVTVRDAAGFGSDFDAGGCWAAACGVVAALAAGGGAR